MKKLLILCVAFLELCCADSALAKTPSTPPILEATEEFLPEAQEFMCAVATNQCKTANAELENLKQLDPVLHAYLSGIAYANGDCVPQSVKKAESSLKYCSKFRFVCRNALMSLYLEFAPGKSEYIKFAMATAEEGSFHAADYLMRYYSPPKSIQDIIKIYYWGYVAFLLTSRLADTIMPSHPDPKYQGGASEVTSIAAEMKRILEEGISNLSPEDAKQIRQSAQRFVARIPLPRSYDTLDLVSNYHFVGSTLVMDPNMKKPDKKKSKESLPSATPPESKAPSEWLKRELDYLSILKS